MARGVVRAYDARTGELRWSWDPIPRARVRSRAHDWAGDSWRRTGAANAWSVDVRRPRARPRLRADQQREPGPLRRRAHRRQPLRELAWSRCAAPTGEVVWHFQVVHHDLWDYDVPAQPTLVTVTRDGKAVPAVRRPPRWATSSCSIARPASPCFRSRSARCRGATVRRRGGLADAAVPRAPAPAGAASGSTADDAWGMTPQEREACRARIARAAHRRHLHAAEPRGHGRLSRLRRRR